MTARCLAASVFAAAVTVASGEDVEACSYPYPVPFEVDATLDDDEPPGVPVVSVASLRRGRGPTHEGCGMSSTSCDDIGSIELTVAPASESVGEEVGYRLEVTNASRAPSSMFVPREAIVAHDGRIWLSWTDGADDDQEPVDFEIAIRTVDRAGNESDPALVEVMHPGSGGCRQAWPAAAWPLGVVVALRAWRRMPRRLV